MWNYGKSPSSGAWQNYSITLHRQWTALIRPFEWLGHRLIEGGNEGQDALPSVLHRREVASLQQPSHHHAEPEFNVVQPTGVLRRLQEPDAMVDITQERCTSRHRRHYPSLLLLPQILFDATGAGDQPHQRL